MPNQYGSLSLRPVAPHGALNISYISQRCSRGVTDEFFSFGSSQNEHGNGCYADGRLHAHGHGYGLHTDASHEDEANVDVVPHHCQRRRLVRVLDGGNCWRNGLELFGGHCHGSSVGVRAICTMAAGEFGQEGGTAKHQLRLTVTLAVAYPSDGDVWSSTGVRLLSDARLHDILCLARNRRLHRSRSSFVRQPP